MTKNAATGAKCNTSGNRCGRVKHRSRPLPTRVELSFESLESRQLLSADAGAMRVGMNLENIVDWSPAWTFTDAFQASRPWINHAFNAATWSTTWDDPATPPLVIDADGNVARLGTWTNPAGQTIRQQASTLMFRGLGGGYAAGSYRAEWDGDGVVSFGFDARVITSGRTVSGRSFADLLVTPSDDGIHLLIESTNPADPVRDFNIWTPDWNSQRFAGQRWKPGESFSPFHPLFLERLAPFKTLRFMAMQETNSSDIRTWADRRDAADIRQGSGPGGTVSEPLVNGMSVEYMVQLANDLDADPWFNMPHMADDDFVRNFAGYVRDHLEPERTVHVEWANEIWNFGWGFEASHWVDAQRGLPENKELDPDIAHWIIAGREAKRDMEIWSDVFAGRPERLVRVAAGWAAVDWVTAQVAEAMGGTFDAIAIAPYLTPTDDQRAAYSASTSVDQVLADTRANLTTSVAWTANHEQLARDWSTRLGRSIQLVAYEGGPHLDGRGESYQAAFHEAGNDPRMGDIYRDYLKGLAAAGMDLYVDFQFTGQPGVAPWGDFAKLHRMDEPLATAHRYQAVVEAANGSLWGITPPAEPAPTTLSVDARGFLSVNGQPVTFEQALATVSFRSWVIFEAAILHDQHMLFAQHSSGSLHRLHARSDWSIVGGLDGVGNASTISLPRSARGDGATAVVEESVSSDRLLHGSANPSLGDMSALAMAFWLDLDGDGAIG
jgi:hypothetical protein